MALVHTDTEENRFSRKLTAVLYADVAGYSRLTDADEEGTHRIVSAYLDLISATVNHYRGSVLHYAGDAVLADFASVLDALNCAIAIQKDIRSRNQSLPPERKVEFRIGINLGDVIVDRGELYGSGVNIAARLESLAYSGGICISEAVYDAVGNKLPYVCKFMGEQRVKNIAKPVRAYHVLLDRSWVGNELASIQPGRRLYRLMMIGGAVILFGTALLVGYRLPFWWNAIEPAVESGETAPNAFVTGKHSIAVLPFVNLSADPQQEYFADGITEDLITDLSQLSGLLVIARNSVFVYKGQAVDIQQVAHDLGVRYVLEGSVRKAGDRVRINAQLIDAATSGHLWAERYDRRMTDIFDLQDEVTEKIIAALAVELTVQEKSLLAQRYTDNLQAYDYFLRGQEQHFRFTQDGYLMARDYYRKAIALDPAFARAYGALAVTYINEIQVGYSDDAQENLAGAMELVQTAIGLDDSLPQAYFAQAYALLFERQHRQAVAALEKAISLDPNYADAYMLQAFVYIHIKNRARDAFPLIERGMQLNPNYSMEYLGILGQASYWTQQYQQARKAFEDALERNRNYLLFSLYLAATYMQLEQPDKAEWEVFELLTLKPDFSLARWAEERPFEDPAQLQNLLDTLRQAGLE